MKIYRFLVALSLVALTACTQGQVENDSQVKHVSAKEFASIVDQGNGQLVDIRTPREYEMGHIEGAQMIDFYAPTFKTALSELDKETPIYIYCRSGSRSSKAVSTLKTLGFKEIVNLQQGIIDWQRSGLTLSK